MHLMKKSIEIKAPVERVYDFFTTPSNLPSIWPSMVEVTNVERRPDGYNSFDWVYKMVGVRFKGHAEPRKVVQNKYIEIKNESGIPSTFRWTYEGRGASTLLTVEVEYAIPTPVFGTVAEAIVSKVNERELESMLANGKTVLEHAVPRAVEAGPAQATR